MSAWTDHVARWKDCVLCPLCHQRDRIVLARGDVPCDVIFVGEAPGASEDATGLPFWGPAGHILDDIIARTVPEGIPYLITNLVCCFPRDAKSRGDNQPEVAEILACRPRLRELIELAQPKLIVCVGTLASDHIGHDAHGKVCGARVVDIIHPAATMGDRMPLAKKQMALQHATVVLRNAVTRMLESGE